MIRSRVFSLITILLIFISTIIYFFVDFRSKEEQAFSYFEQGKYEKILRSYSLDSKYLSDQVLALLSQSISHLEKKLNESKTQEETLLFLSKNPQIKTLEWKTDLGTYTHIEDPYLLQLKKHNAHYKKSLIVKTSILEKLIPKKNATYYLLLLILEDPRGNEVTYSQALANLLRFPLDEIGELESLFLLETLSYLSTSTSSLFYENLFIINGTNVNLRSGPGKENKEIAKVSSPEITFCFDNDIREITVSGKSGQFRRCYFPNIAKSAWVFSGFLEKATPRQNNLDSFEQRFKSLGDEVKIDFEGWLGDKIPQTFYGDYIPRDRVVFSGEVGFPLYGNKSKNMKRICKKITGEKNYFEFSYFPSESKEMIKMTELYLVYKGQSHLAYSIESDWESILINRNRYILDEDRKRENLSLHIESREGDKLVASLWQRNTGLLQSLKSSPMDNTILSSGNYSWEICLPLAIAVTKEKALLFEIKTGIH